MTAREVVELIKKNVGVQWREGGRDTFKIGDPETTVTGIATTFMSTFDMLKKAQAEKLNFIITHEDTWWNDPDNTKSIAENPVYKAKLDFIQKNGLILWRFHDHQHGRVPDQSVVAELRLAAIDDPKAATSSGQPYVIPETTLGELASKIQKKTGARAIRVTGDPKMKVTRIRVGPGYAFPRMTPDTDVIVGGEAQEADGGFDYTSYARDAAALGIPKGQIMLGHQVSEEPGMEEFTNWLRGFVTGVPIKWIPAGEPWWS
jgi:putative NIF3 family GTP cyclohydrolase 1 type 2